MKRYPSISTVWRRDPATDYKTLIEGEWATPEFAYLKDCVWEHTEKFDGTCVRVMWDGEVLTFGGRTDNAQMPTFLYAKLQERFCAEKMAEVFDGPMCLYGEGIGAKIQKGGGNYISDGVDFVLFDVFASDLWLKREDVHDIAVNLGIRVVPVVGIGPLESAIAWVQDSHQSTIGDHDMEGLVMRPSVELLDRRGNRIITKIKTKDFQ